MLLEDVKSDVKEEKTWWSAFPCWQILLSTDCYLHLISFFPFERDQTILSTPFHLLTSSEVRGLLACPALLPVLQPFFGWHTFVLSVDAVQSISWAGTSDPYSWAVCELRFWDIWLTFEVSYSVSNVRCPDRWAKKASFSVAELA